MTGNVNSFSVTEAFKVQLLILKSVSSGVVRFTVVLNDSENSACLVNDVLLLQCIIDYQNSKGQ